MQDISVQTLVMRLLSMLLIAPLSGLIAAVTARFLGDMGPIEDGRLIVNPIAHLDLIGLAAAAAFGIGWSKPVDLALQRLRGGALGALAVIAAVTAALIVLALLAGWLRTAAALNFSDSSAPLVGGFLQTLALIAASTALFNLVPVPPLTGGYLLAALAPALHARLRSAAIIVGIVLLAVLATGQPQSITRSIATSLNLV